MPDFTEAMKDFDGKWKLYMGDCVCNKEAFFKPLLLSKLTEAYARGRSDALKEAKEAVPQEKHAKAVDVSEAPAVYMAVGYNEHRDDTLRALAELTKVGSLHKETEV